MIPEGFLLAWASLLLLVMLTVSSAFVILVMGRLIYEVFKKEDNS